MADTVKVEPTPIQRNKHDVAIELLKIHISRKATSAEELEGIFAKYYALATYCESLPVDDLQNLLSNELLEKSGTLKSYDY